MKAQLLEELEELKVLTLSDFYHNYNRFIDRVASCLREGSITKEDVASINRSFGDDFLHNTLQGHSLLKPYGYAGDFLIIDKFYAYYMSANPAYNKWDAYCQQHSAPRAVRNRKEVFKSEMMKRNGKDGKVNILNLASGPGRDLFEFFEEAGGETNVQVTCVEMDESAIDYARKINKLSNPHIAFIKKNICRFNTTEKYDLIWAGGLFDYFTDKAFLALIRRFKSWLKPDGEIIIGNFNKEYNPTRNYMELFGEWYLNHRNYGELEQLAWDAGFDEEHISISNEPEKVNLFLHMSYG
jgi:ubiquinone/menaquinone biosynthesis C-methylase UbiE